MRTLCRLAVFSVVCLVISGGCFGKKEVSEEQKKVTARLQQAVERHKQLAGELKTQQRRFEESNQKMLETQGDERAELREQMNEARAKVRVLEGQVQGIKMEIRSLNRRVPSELQVSEPD